MILIEKNNAKIKPCTSPPTEILVTHGSPDRAFRSPLRLWRGTRSNLRLLPSAASLDGERLWAIEDCRLVTRRLDRDLITAGESVHTDTKSDPLPSPPLRWREAGLRVPTLPITRLDGVERAPRLLVEHREHLPAKPTRISTRLH